MKGFVFFNCRFLEDPAEIVQDILIENKWSAHTVRGFNAHYNKWDALTNLELEVEGLYRIIQNENTLESPFFFALPVFANINTGRRL